MKWIFKIFTDHPRAVGETYWTHFLSASKISMRCGIGCLSQFVHAVLPFIHPPFASDVKSLTQFLKELDPKSRSQKTVNTEGLSDHFGSD